MKRDSPEDSFAIGRRESIGFLLGAQAFLAGRSTLLAGQSGQGASRETLVYGGGLAPLPSMELRAGPLSLRFEPETASVRFVRVGDREVLRAVYAAVRDRNWGTVPSQVRDLRVEQRADGFEVTFSVRCQADPIDFTWNGILRGEADGTLRFRFDGTAQSRFLRNRVGFCVLHPAELAGTAVQVETVDGERLRERFPEQISPHQPFLRVRVLSHTVSDGLEAEVRMTGDTFETEDQRNWTDASFKTYCTPLALPFPVELHPGDRIQQEVAVTIRGARPPVAADPPTAAPVELAVEPGRALPMPPVGLGISSISDHLSSTEVTLLKRLNLAHLRVDLRLSEASAMTTLTRAASQANALGSRLEIAVHVDADPEVELQALATALKQNPAPVARFLVFHRKEKGTTQRWLNLARGILQGAAQGAAICGGTDAYFTELNRFRPPLAAVEGVSYSVNPQVHAFDNLSLVETLSMHEQTLASARAICGDLPLHVSPVTLKPRFNPNATAAATVPAGPLRELPPEVDARQPSLFTAAWTVGSLKYLAQGGAASVTFYETVGWRGIVETSQGSALPAKFPSQPGAVFPAYHAFAAVADFRGGEVIPVRSNSILDAEAMLLRIGARRRLIVCNLSDQPRIVRITGFVGPSGVRLRMLDEYTALSAGSDPDAFWSVPGQRHEAPGGTLQLALLPYAVAFLDG